MPWQEASAAGEQRRFIEAWLRGEETVAALCRRFGISRKTGYKRINRFKAWGSAGLGDRSRAPHTHPQATSAEVTRQVIAVKRAHPTWGPKKVVTWLRTARPEGCWPAPSTAGAILQRAGLVQPRRPPPERGVEYPVHRGDGGQRRVVHGLQGLVPDDRWDPDRSADRAGCRLPLPAGLSGADPTARPTGPPGAGTGLARVWPATGDPHR